MNIAAVDDEASILDSISIALGAEHRIYACKSFSELLNCLSSHHLDLIICDFDLGPKNLSQFLGEKSLSIPILVLTGKADRQDVIDLLNFGVFGFLEKPLRIHSLEKCIDKIKISSMSKAMAWLENVGVKYNPTDRTVIYKEVISTLTPIECRILEFLIGQNEKEVLKADIQKYLWPDLHVAQNTLDTHLVNLKRKLPPFKENLSTKYGGVLMLMKDCSKSA